MREEAFHYYAHDEQGAAVELLNTMALRENYSAVPIHIDYISDAPTGDGRPNRYTDFPLNRITRQLLGRLSATEDAYRLLALLLMRRLMDKYQPVPVLWAGGTHQPWEGLLSNILNTFHPQSQLYRLNAQGEATTAQAAVWQMPWAQVLLPEAAFAVLIIDTLAAPVPWQEELARQMLLSLRPYGECLVLAESGQTTWLEQMRARFGTAVQVYVSATGSVVGQVQLTPALRQQVADKTLVYTVRQAREACQKLVAQAQALLAQPDWEPAAVLELAEAVEQYLLWLFPYLHSTTVKYHAKERQRLLLEYHLGYGTREEVLASWQTFLQDFQTDFV